MPLDLTDADLARVIRAITALLSPLEFGSHGEWARAVVRASRTAVAADRAELYLPEWTAGRRLLRMWEQGPDGEETVPVDEALFDEAARGRRHRRPAGDEAGRRMTIYERAEPDEIEFGININGENGVRARLSFHHHHTSHPWSVERGVALLQLLGPAFAAGLSTYLRSSRRRAVLPQMLDDLDIALALFDSKGQVLHETLTLTQLLVADPDASRLRTQMASVGSAVAHRFARVPLTRYAVPPPLVRQVRTDRERYSVRAVSVAAALESTTATILVLLERLRVQPLSDEVLRERYRLTPREIEVARLLGHGRRNDEIAEALGISSRTAEHHTQRVLMKLGSRSRAQVGDRLRGE